MVSQSSQNWIGIDGEGIGQNPHRYVMLCASNASGNWCDYIEDVNGLSTRDCLEWLLGLPPSRVAGYYLSYDWTMILRDLPNKSIYRLLRPEVRARPKDEGGGFTHIRWQGYDLHFLSGMMQITRGKARTIIWDVGKFFQARFTVALERSGLAPPELIKRLKGERGSEVWTTEYLDTIRMYCLEECQYLAKLVELLERQHMKLSLHLKRWHGPGSTAKAALAHHHVEDYLAKAPPVVELAALCAYFGGRFEQAHIGLQHDVSAHDIRSAYPHAASTLPCLVHGRWVHRTREPKPDEVALVRYRITDIGERVWGPLPCRLQDGSIVWPRAGSTGWVWSVEYHQAKLGWSGVEFAGEAWVLERQCDCAPFEFIPDMYAYRIAHPENKQVIKLAMNSVYGVLAQIVGGKGKYSCRIWAGIITATCRARMLEFIRTSEDESKVHAIATDGVFSSEKRDIESPELGGWEVTYKGDMVFLRPGIYWSVEDVQNAEQEKAINGIKARGIGRRHLYDQIQAAIQALANGDERAMLGVTRLFGGARDCIRKTQGGEYRRSALYGEWFQSPATLSLCPEPKRDKNWRPPSLIRQASFPFAQQDFVESMPYTSKTKSIEAQALKRIGSLLESRL